MSFANIGNSLNLPSEECYNVFNDSKGYMWICTENGLCRYNGKNLKIFNKDNGLPEGAVYYISEDTSGIIHVITSQNRILKIDISIELNLLKIVIEDNGIGRARSNEYKKVNLHNPVGMKLTEQRLSIIQKIQDYEEIKVSVSDLHDPAGNACGTCVELFLPLSIYK
ncbi:MAG: signal transduction histidine kinase, LytS [Bacteroidetes bacterium]|nr:signal transduction histidine kinase, LytS [Bacteroidota bacterium]